MSNRPELNIANLSRDNLIFLHFEDFIGNETSTKIEPMHVVKLPSGLMVLAAPFWFSHELVNDQTDTKLALQNDSANWEGTVDITYLDNTGPPHTSAPYIKKTLRRGCDFNVPLWLILGQAKFKAVPSIG